MPYFHDDDGNDDQTPTPPSDHPAGTSSGDYTLPDEIGTRVGEGEDHNPTTLGNVEND